MLGLFIFYSCVIILILTMSNELYRAPKLESSLQESSASSCSSEKVIGHDLSMNELSIPILTPGETLGNLSIIYVIIFIMPFFIISIIISTIISIIISIMIFYNDGLFPLQIFLSMVNSQNVKSLETTLLARQTLLSCTAVKSIPRSWPNTRVPRH